MTDFRVNVIVDPDPAKRGGRQVEQALDNVQKKAGALRTAISGALAGFATFSTIKSILQLADTYQNLQNRLRAVSAEGTDLVATQAAIEDVARRTRSSLAATTELYARLITTSKELGKTQGEILAFTESLNKAITLSGASAGEAEAGILQLSQGLASGALRGDELRSVLEQLPAVADVIARGMGVTRGELRKLGQDGKISAQAIFDAFERLAPELDEKFGRTVPTLSQSMAVFKNEVLAFVGVSDQASGATRSLGAAFQFLGEKIKEARDFYNGYAEVAREPQTEAALSSVGAQIVSINKQLRELESREVISDGVRKRIEDLRQQLAAFQAQASQATALADPVNPEQVKANQALVAAQKKVLEDIKGPQEAYELKLRAINGLLAEGKITQEEYNLQLEKLNKSLEKVAGPDAAKAFEDQLKALQEQADVTRTRLALGDVAADRLQIEQELAAKGIKLTDEQKAQLEKLLNTNRELAIVEENLTALRENISGKPTQEAIDAKAQELDVTTQLLSQEKLLNAVLLQRKDLAPQVAEALENLKLRQLEASTALSDGFTRAFIKIKKEAEDLAAVGEKVVNVFADRATDALVEFATTGKLNFKKFAQDILADITRIIARLLVVQALNAAFGGGGTTASNALQTGASLAGARASGGPVSAGRTYLVGENGPELFTPPSNGKIVPNEQLQQPQPQQVNVQVVNVQDPSLVPQAISSGAATEPILNVLSENREFLKQLVQ